MAKSRKEVYELVKGLENGEETVDFLTTEFGKVGTAEAAARVSRTVATEAQATLESKKEILAYLQAQNLTQEDLTGLVTSREAALTDAERVTNEIKALRGELSEVRTELSAEKDAKAALEASEKSATLVTKFSEALPNILPKALKTDLTLAAKLGDLRMNDEGAPEGKIGDAWFPVKEYAEKYKDANPEYIVTKPGPNSDSTTTIKRGDIVTPKYTKDELNAMSAGELMELGYKNLENAS